eukprot:2744014-Pleurochrysis_carterae.AAC.1
MLVLFDEQQKIFFLDSEQKGSACTRLLVHLARKTTAPSRPSTQLLLRPRRRQSKLSSAARFSVHT